MLLPTDLYNDINAFFIFIIMYAGLVYLFCYTMFYFTNTQKINMQRLGTRIVRTKYGKLRGVLILPFDNKLRPVEAFLGVPYARPPVGELRFNPPKTPLSWDHVLQCDELPMVCPQVLPETRNEQEALKKMPRGRLRFIQRLIPYLRKQSEDCLYMNIYVPYNSKYIHSFY